MCQDYVLEATPAAGLRDFAILSLNIFFEEGLIKVAF
jgi:hypothetical protein